MSDSKENRPFGLWQSPITPDSMAQGIRLSEIAWDSDGERLVWLEGRSDRGVLVCAGPGNDAPRDLTTGLSVRAKVGYGGGDVTVSHGHVYFVEKSGRIYRQPLGTGQAKAITPAFGHAASPAVSPDGKWLVFVHSYERIDRLAIVDVEGQHWPQQFASGADFYMQPRWHPQGKLLAWIEWDHPNMPWDGTRLCVATVEQTGSLPQLGAVRQIAGGKDIAIFQPEFSPDGRYLAYISDETGWGNLYLYDLESGEQRALTNERAELGTPAWVQGLRTYGFRHDGQAIYYLRNELGFRTLWLYDLKRGESRSISSGLDTYTWIESTLAVAPNRDALAAVASASTIPDRVVVIEPGEGGQARILARSEGETVAPSELSLPKAISWTSGAATAHGLYYPPASSRYTGTGLPPAILLIHGGPTSQSIAKYSPQVQFFTTRGYAVLQVNYRGSTGYGRDYMLALRGAWGVVDVEDAISGARYLAESGLADPSRMVIMGGSAGGYTVLQVLAHHPGVFKAGICNFGVSNLFNLAADTHKFEERYLDTIVGPLPEAHALYRERSPIFFADRIRDPLAIFQGSEDTVVPRDQSDSVVEALRRRGVPHQYKVYEGEGHGWRKSETIKDFYTSVEKFLRQYVLFA